MFNRLQVTSFDQNLAKCNLLYESLFVV